MRIRMAMLVYMSLLSIPVFSTGMSFTYYPLEPTTADGMHFIANTTGMDTVVHIWSFGDGEHTVGGSDTYHRYREDNSYNVVLTVIDTQSHAWQTNKTIHVENDPPEADFTWNIPKPNPMDNIIFTDTSTDSDGQITWWGWRIDNGTLYENRVLSHVFIENGEYHVNLTVRDNDNGTGYREQTVEIKDNHNPYAVFTIKKESIEENEKICIKDISYDTDGTIERTEWSFGDGSTKEGEQVCHSYGKKGTYTIRLRVWDDDDAESNFSKKITVTGSTENSMPGLMTLATTISISISYLAYGRKKK